MYTIHKLLSTVKKYAGVRVKMNKYRQIFNIFVTRVTLVAQCTRDPKETEYINVSHFIAVIIHEIVSYTLEREIFKDRDVLLQRIYK